MNRLFLLTAMLLISVSILTACSSGESIVNPLGAVSNPDSSVIPEIFGTFEPYQNPYNGDPGQAREGEILYQANCSSCHGVTGLGDGPAARRIEPRPKDLSAEIDELSDGYLYWRIYDGGLMEPFNSVMPAWKGLMNEEQIWQVITFLRTLGSP